jgi:hypothetical protein
LVLKSLTQGKKNGADKPFTLVYRDKTDVDAKIARRKS